MPVSDHFSRDELLTSHCLLCISRAATFALKLIESLPLGRRRFMDSWWLFFAVGFGAQLVDGTLGMAYGVLSNTALMAIWLPPAHASALVHTEEIFTTSASAASHIYHRNVDWRLWRDWESPGFLAPSSVPGFCRTSKSHPRGVSFMPMLLMGLYILWKSTRIALEARKPAGWMALLGFAGGFLDASGGADGDQ